ncbi:hypothetical protein [Thiobacter aerophilum]|uniref:Uncharacterized protein n=1 Tax=Thiobacter aerophilum TaxID=3121275 RepID=A0ABV0EG25_9BURK
MERGPIEITVEQLRSLIGLRVLYRSEPHVVIEVIEDERALVLAPEGCGPSIQADAYGNARRRARTLITVPVLSADRTALHADFLDLDLP